MRADDVADFEEFMRAKWPSMVRTARSLGCDASEAQDVAQTALFNCLRKWSRVRRTDDPHAYAYRCVVNAFVSKRRLSSTRERPTSPEDCPRTVVQESHESHVLDREDLRRALQRLPIEQRAVVVLRYVDDLSEAQIARVLNIATGTVKSRCSRGIDTLERELSQPNQSTPGGPR